MPHLSTYVALADHSEQILAESLRTLAEGRPDVHDVFHMCQTLAKMSDAHRDNLRPAVQRYGEDQDVDEPERLRATGVAEVRGGEVGLLRDLQDIHLLATLVRSTWMVVSQGAQGLRDRELLKIAQDSMVETGRQLTWLETRMKAAAPQALIVAP
jgi:hypothetical protein